MTKLIYEVAVVRVISNRAGEVRVASGRMRAA